MSRSEAESAGDFWSRRRAAVAEETRAEARAVEQAEADEARAALEEKSDTEILETLGLKDPDTLEQGDDFAAFLKSEVPDRLRRRALRRLWRSNPVLANLDSLVDYGEDFTDAATVVEDLQTAYRVGKGMLAHIEKQLEAARVEDAPETAVYSEADAAGEAGDDPVAEVPVPTAPESAVASGSEPGAGPETGVSPLDTQENQSERGALTQEARLPSPRRMRFVYGGTPEESL